MDTPTRLTTAEAQQWWAKTSPAADQARKIAELNAWICFTPVIGFYECHDFSSSDLGLRTALRAQRLKDLPEYYQHQNRAGATMTLVATLERDKETGDVQSQAQKVQ